MIRSVIMLVLTGWLSACGGAPPASVERSGATPSRVVSLDYCADQFVLKLLPKERILAVSPHATRDFSYMREAAEGLPTVRAVAEDVLVLKPDLVVRSYGGGPKAAEYFQRAGIDVLQVGWTPDLDAVRTNILQIAEALGEEDRGRDIVTEIDRRLENLSHVSETEEALYVTPGGATSGPGSLVHEMIVVSGYDNFERRSGWHELPLERLAREAPDQIIFASFDGGDRILEFGAPPRAGESSEKQPRHGD